MKVSEKIDMRDAFFERVYELALKHQNIYFLSVDHGAFALEKFQREMSDRYINIGIAEQNMVGVGAGLALSGEIVFGYGISPFVSLRVLEQLTLDVAAMNANVNIISVGAGFTYSTDGPSHQGLQDLAAILTIPNMTILNSSDPSSTRAFADMAVEIEGPKYIRIEKGILPHIDRGPDEDFSTGLSSLHTGKDLTIVATGAIVHQAINLRQILQAKNNWDVGIIDLFRVKPINSDALLAALNGTNQIITLEEGFLDGGMGAHVAAILLENSQNKPFRRFGIKNHFCYEYGSRDYLLDFYELSAEKIAKKLII